MNSIVHAITLDEFYKCNIEHKKLNTKEYTVHDSTCPRFLKFIYSVLKKIFVQL